MSIKTWLRNKLRAWLGVEAPHEETVEQAATRKGISIAQEVLRRAGEKNVPTRRFQAPALPRGVIPTESFRDDPGGLGPYMALDSELVAPSYAYANDFNCGLAFPGYPYLAELSQRSEYRAPSETIASEMTREWLKLIVKGKTTKNNDKAEDAVPPKNANKGLEDKIERLNELLEEFKVREAFAKCAELDGLFGRAQLFIDIDPQGKDEDEARQLPLLIKAETIKKGSLRQLKVIEPMWTTPYTYNAINPLAPDFYKPRAWFVMGKRTHATRLITFISREVPDMLKPAYNFSGLSMSQLMESYVFQWLRTRNSVSDLIHNFSVMCLQTDMSAILSGEPDQPGGLADRARLFVQYRDNQGLTVLDKDREALAAVNVPLANLDKLQAQAQEHMAAPSHIPLVKLLGITPTGLNANSEGEIKVFYDFVRAQQQRLFNDPINLVIQVLQLHEWGVIDDAIGFEWVPLSAPTVKELAEIRKANAETDKTYVDMSAVSPDEVRERIAADPDSGYNNLTGPAPEPPELSDIEEEPGQPAEKPPERKAA